jgi:hypothetical protein
MGDPNGGIRHNPTLPSTTLNFFSWSAAAALTCCRGDPLVHVQHRSCASHLWTFIHRFSDRSSRLRNDGNQDFAAIPDDARERQLLTGAVLQTDQRFAMAND